MTKWFCDRCEKEIPIATWSTIKVDECYSEVSARPGPYNTQIATSEPVLKFSNISLCPKCAKQLNEVVMKFMKYN